MAERYELEITGEAEVERAVWHSHDGMSWHFHTAEEYRRHPIMIEEQRRPTEDDE